MGAEQAGKLSPAANSTNSTRGLSKYPQTRGTAELGCGGTAALRATCRTGTNCLSEPPALSCLCRGPPVLKGNFISHRIAEMHQLGFFFFFFFKWYFRQIQSFELFEAPGGRFARRRDFSYFPTAGAQILAGI